MNVENPNTPTDFRCQPLLSYPNSFLQVRVPTHEDGTCLFWEFATDNYDIGFGVYFEWTKDTSNVVSVHISESEEEEEEEEPEGS